MKNFRMRKLGVLLMTLCLAVVLLSTGALAIVADVDEGNDPGLQITDVYKTNVELRFTEYSADGEQLKHLYPVTVSLDVRPDNDSVAAAAADEVAAMEAKFTVTKTDETTRTEYFSPQVLNGEGNIVVCDSLDALMDAYVAQGAAISNLEIHTVTTIIQKYDVVRRAETPRLPVKSVIIGSIAKPVAGAAPQTTVDIITDPADAVESYELRWTEELVDKNNEYLATSMDWDRTAFPPYEEIELDDGTIAHLAYRASIDIFLKDDYYFESEPETSGFGKFLGSVSLDGDMALNDDYTWTEGSHTAQAPALWVTTVDVAPAEPIPAPQDVKTVKLTGATLSFQAGDKPKFTAKTAEADKYFVYVEQWTEVGTGRYITSSDFFNRDKDKLITAFEEGKEYAYSVWVKPAEGKDAAGNFLYYKTDLGACTKLDLGGKDVTITAEKLDDMDEAGVWLKNVATFKAAKATVTTPTGTKPTSPPHRRG